MTIPPLPAHDTPPPEDDGRPPLELPPLDDSAPAAAPPEPAGEPPPLPESRSRVEFTDDDLREALHPLLPKAPTPPEAAAATLPEDFEPTLRAALRRTLAEHGRGPFDPPDFLQRASWRFSALFTSRSYEEVVETKTHRFRIEEVYLFEPDTLALISYASTNPGRHADARRVERTANRLAVRLEHFASGRLEPRADNFGLPRGLDTVVRGGEHAFLIALVRGEPDARVEGDLDHLLHTIETDFGHRIATGQPLLREIQPYLEESLLIHAPLAPVS